MGCDELRQGIRACWHGGHVIVVERLDLTDFRQTPPPILHPRMRRRRTRSWSPKNKLAAHGTFLYQWTRSNTAVASISSRNAGSARGETPIQVLAGGFSGEKNSRKAIPTAVPHSA